MKIILNLDNILDGMSDEEKNRIPDNLDSELKKEVERLMEESGNEKEEKDS